MGRGDRQSRPNRDDRFRGLLLGTAVGDSLGYPAEGLSRRRIGKLFRGRWRHRLLWGPGIVSDDTDHTVFVTQALLMHPDDLGRFAHRLARSLRWWLVGLPPGLGKATLISIVRLWAGFDPARSGIFSAGNGAAMRAAVIGAFFADDRARMDAYLHAQTVLTHTDPKALAGARAVAYLAAWAVRADADGPPAVDEFRDLLVAAGRKGDGWNDLARAIADAAAGGATVEAFAGSLGLSDGVSGYVYHTVPVALYAWFRHFGDFEATLQAVLDCGGDTDTIAAIAGAVAGTVTGESGIPEDWLAGLAGWPVCNSHLRKIAGRACEGSLRRVPLQPVPYFWPGMLPRNLFALALTLFHLMRRLAPPW